MEEHLSQEGWLIPVRIPFGRGWRKALITNDA